MVLKRQLRDRDDETSLRESKRRPEYLNVGRDLVKGFPTHEFLIKLEPFLRNVVQEEVESLIRLFQQHDSQSSFNQIKSSQTSDLQLHFVDKIRATIFTGNRVESEDGKPIKVVLRDAVSKKILTSVPLSSIKIEILVLDGDFGSDDQEDWSEDEFKEKLVREREGKKPLLIGELRTTLKDGVGYVGEVVFSDNSSWIRSRRFRLGARVVQGTYDEVRIREARSVAFGVKDQRGESYKKHHPPTMEDEIWRLEKIAKEGAFHRRLAGKGINTVRELTQLYHVNPTYLRDVFGGGISNKIWEKIIEHAVECVVDEKMYAYSKDATVAVVFDAIFKLVGVIFDRQTYQSLDKLSDFQLGLVNSLKGQAYKNVNDWVLLDDLSVFVPAMPSSSLQPDPYSSPSSGLEQVFPNVQEDQLEMQSIPNYMTQPSYVRDVAENVFMETNFFGGPYAGDNSQISDYSFQFCQSPWQVNDFLSGPSNGVAGISSPKFSMFTKNATPRARWRMIKAALTWGISVRRDVAAKKMAKPFYPAFLGYSY